MNTTTYCNYINKCQGVKTSTIPLLPLPRPRPGTVTHGIATISRALRLTACVLNADLHADFFMQE
jgi:hypothetical protein